MGKDIIVGTFSGVDMSSLELPMVVVYENPTDYPEKYVARLWDREMPSNIVLVADSLYDIRSEKPGNMMVLHRDKVDDPVIVETWI